LNAAEKESGKPFNEDEFKMFRVLGDVLALFLENQWFAGRLHETQRLSVDEIADLSHEFRIPLTCLREALAILRDEIPGSLNEKQKQYLEMAQQNIGRMNERIDIFIQGAKDAAEGAFSKPERKRIDLVRWSEEILGAFKAKAERSGIHLRRGSDTPKIEIWGDPERLGEVLTNFIDNAIKYSKPRGEVLLKAAQTRGRIRMAVEDHGRGIPKEEQKKIFDRFYRLKKAQESGVEGHGLGLALCQKIVKAHGGTIGVESTKGQGSTFWFEIPAVPPKVQEVRWVHG
jgi:signal transduction histidine kinase